MWVLTSFGAFMPALRPPATVAKGDQFTMQIRARRRVDLNRLRRHYLPELGPTYVVPDSDYQVRANCKPRDWERALVRISREIDYVSFKDTTVTKWRDHQLHDAYLRVWWALSTLGAARKNGKRSRQVRHQEALLTDAEIEAWLNS